MKMPRTQIPILEKTRVRVEEIRAKAKTRIAEWKERGWRTAPAGTQRGFPLFKEIREKGLASAIRARREGMRAQRRAPEEIEPAYPKTRLVKEAEEIRPTVGKREIAIEV